MAFFSIMLLSFLIITILGFYFFKSSKQLPKTWHEWKAELSIQRIGITGLIQDTILKNHNKVELYSQPDRIAVITGGNRGIGLEIVKKLLQCDMTVVMGCRDPESGKENVSKIIDLTKIKGKLICEKLDIGNISSIKEFAKIIKEKFDKIDILLNNAGIMFAPFKITEDGFESHFVVNYLGHFLLTHLLLQQLKAAGTNEKNSRIINVSSIVNLIGKINYEDINGRKRYYPAIAYNQSKLAQILFTRHLNKILETEGAHVQVHAVHPGVVDTDLFANSSTTAVPGLKKILFKTPEEGSRAVVYAAISPELEGRGGSYLSNCVRAKTHPVAKNPEKCEKMFRFSCELLGIENFCKI